MEPSVSDAKRMRLNATTSSLDQQTTMDEGERWERVLAICVENDHFESSLSWVDVGHLRVVSKPTGKYAARMALRRMQSVLLTCHLQMDGLVHLTHPPHGSDSEGVYVPLPNGRDCVRYRRGCRGHMQLKEGSTDTFVATRHIYDQWDWHHHQFPAEFYKGHRICLGMKYTKYINPVDVFDECSLGVIDMVHPDDMQVGISVHNGAKVQILFHGIVDNVIGDSPIPRMWKRYYGAVSVLEVQGITFGSIMDVIQTNMSRQKERNAAQQTVVADARE